MWPHGGRCVKDLPACDAFPARPRALPSQSPREDTSNPMRAHKIALAACVAILGAACQSAPPPSTTRDEAEPSARAKDFDAHRAWAHLEALAAIGPRPMGSDGDARARAYLRAQLEKLGLEIREQHVQVGVGSREPFDVVNLGARIPGRSDDSIVIATTYDTRAMEESDYQGANEAASGPAVVLEMARVLKQAPLDYDTWVVFLDGDAPLAPGQPPSHFGARALGKRLAGEHVLEQIRLALVVASVCDPDLHIARDLLSERIYRQEFWAAAARLGHADAFAPGSDFESPDASQRPFADVGLRRVVALVDTSFGGDEPPGIYAGTTADDLEHCSQDSLGIVGSVSLEALGTISARLAKIDRFARSPVSEAQDLAWDSFGADPSKTDETSPAAEETQGDSQAPAGGAPAEPVEGSPGSAAKGAGSPTEGAR